MTFGIFHGWAYCATLLEKLSFNFQVLFGYSFGLFFTQLITVFLGYQLFKFSKRFKSSNFSVTPIFCGIMIGVASVNLLDIFESAFLNFLN